MHAMPSRASSTTSSSSSSYSSSSSSTGTAAGMRRPLNFEAGSSRAKISYKEFPKQPSLALKFVGYCALKPRKANHIRKYTEENDEDRDEDEDSIVSVFRGNRTKTQLHWVTRRHGSGSSTRSSVTFEEDRRRGYTAMPANQYARPFHPEGIHIPANVRVGTSVPTGVPPIRPYNGPQPRPPVSPGGPMPMPGAGPAGPFGVPTFYDRDERVPPR